MIIYEDHGLKIHRLLLNDIRTNCFIVQQGRRALLIDPVDNPEKIIAYLRHNNLELEFMMSTHAQFDHVFAASGIIEHGLVENLYLHEDDFSELRKAKSFCAVIYKKKLQVPHVKMFDDKLAEFLLFLNLGIQHVGGHTKGSCYVYDLDKKFIITGDLALNHQLRTSLFDNRENLEEIYNFLMAIRRDFKENALIFPGHGDTSYLGIELRKNTKWHYIIQKSEASN